jgi:hypothetical protein
VLPCSPDPGRDDDDRSAHGGAKGDFRLLGTIWRNDPSEDMITLLLTNAAWTSPNPPAMPVDFLTDAYAPIDDEGLRGI